MIRQSILTWNQGNYCTVVRQLLYCCTVAITVLLYSTDDCAIIIMQSSSCNRPTRASLCCNTMHPGKKPASTWRTYADNDRLVCPRHTNLAPHQMWVDPDRLYAPVEGVLLGVTDKIDHGDDILSATISTLLEFGFVERDVHDGGEHQTKRTRHARTLAAKLDYDRMRMREAFTHEQFNATDADGDGKLDLAEFLQFWRTSQNCPDESQPSEEQIKESFSLLDRDGDGRLDVQEFLRFLKSRGLENKSFNQSPFLETHQSPGTSPGKNVDRNWEFDL